MSKTSVSLKERQKIKDSLKATKERRKVQTIKVFELKVNCHHTSKETFNKFDNCFKQAKWVYNDMLNFGNVEGNDIFKYEYLDHKTITRLDKDGNKINEKLDLAVVFHRAIVKQLKTNISNLSKAKKKGLKVGALKYVSEINSIPIITGFIKIKDKKHITIPSFKNLCVYGLDQLDKYKDYEIADGRLIRKASGYYIKISVCINKNEFKSEKIGKSVGLDFGIRKNITTSDGEKFNCNVPESEQLKFLQKQLHRKQEGSKRYYKLLNQIRREYEHLSNKKTDEANKLVHYLKTNNDVIYFQDEQIANWKKKKRNKKNGKVNNRLSFGKQIQHSYLGRVKSKLVSLEKEGKSFKISKWKATTKFCPNCGCLNDIGDSETYICECGYTEDRDVHASRNILMFGSTKRAEWLEQPSVEELVNTSLNASHLDLQINPLKRKQKATTL